LHCNEETELNRGRLVHIAVNPQIKHEKLQLKPDKLISVLHQHNAPRQYSALEVGLSHTMRYTN